MSKNSAESADKVEKYLYTQNRELSWLRFNNRVLEEAADETVPLLERLKFISIFSSNLDEFFMVRVGSLFDLSLISPEQIDNKTGMDAAEQLSEIFRAVAPLYKKRDKIYREVAGLLCEKGIAHPQMESLTAEERSFAEKYFIADVLPVLSPQIINAHHPFPHLVNKAIYIVLQM